MPLEVTFLARAGVGHDRPFTPADSVVNADCGSWDIPNIFICNGPGRGRRQPVADDYSYQEAHCRADRTDRPAGGPCEMVRAAPRLFRGPRRDLRRWRPLLSCCPTAVHHS